MAQVGEAKVSLFHATSTIFVPSIMEHGLGAVDPLRRARAFELARRVLPPVGEGPHDDEGGRFSVKYFRRMVAANSAVADSKSACGTLNLAHGDTYLCASRTQALKYAMIPGSRGSEFLNYLNAFMGLLRANSRSFDEGPLHEEFAEVYDMLEATPFPRLIEVTLTGEMELVTETGGDAADSRHQVVQIHSAYRGSGTEDPEPLEGIAFRLRSVIAPDLLKVWEL